MVDKRPKVLVFAGSLRKDSYNKKLACLAVEAAEEAGAEVTYLDLLDLDLPLYNADYEQEWGLPAGAVRLKELMKASDGLIIAAPEYNSSMTAVTKNTLDWASRPQGDNELYEATKGKVVGLVSASPGKFGGSRGLRQLRLVLAQLKALVIPEEHAVADCQAVFDDNGKISEQHHVEGVGKVVRGVVQMISRLQ